MKIILCLCFFSATNAAYPNNYYTDNAIIQEYVPIIQNGVPVDTPEVQAAKAQHFEAYTRAQALAAKQPSDGQYREEYNLHGFPAPSRTHQHQHQSYVAFSSAAPKAYNYVQEDTVEVQRARTAHLQALARSNQYHQYRHKRSLQATPEVQAARIQHLIAHASAHLEHNDDQTNAYENYYGFHIPLITRKGVPVDTSEVQLARQQHKLAHYVAKTGAQLFNDGGYHSNFVPIIGPNGTPYETRDVQLARTEHFIAHGQEAARH